MFIFYSALAKSALESTPFASIISIERETTFALVSQVEIS